MVPFSHTPRTQVPSGGAPESETLSSEPASSVYQFDIQDEATQSVARCTAMIAGSEIYCLSSFASKRSISASNASRSGKGVLDFAGGVEGIECGADCRPISVNSLCNFRI